jgi:secreted trypsin-like serine protease
MRAVSVALASILIPSMVGAEGPKDRPRPIADATVAPVVGGDDAPAGKWDDAAAIIIGGGVACTGTLIAPNVALTAGHCNDPSLSAVLLGTNSLSRRADGETIPVSNRIALRENDITVLVLAKAATTKPRAIASGWAQYEIKNGAPVAIVGYGAIDRNAQQSVNELQEAESTITDFDCSTKSGCDQFELGAGGMGIDSCNGDSGGPLYLLTDFGDFLVGVTSRAYSNATDPCGQGGIYGRPDQVLAQIETAAGRKVERGPEPTAENVVAIRNDGGETSIVANDPRSKDHSFAVTTQPTMGTAKVREDGVVRVCANRDAMPGDSDSLVVMVTDKSNPNRKVPVKIGISIALNDPAGGSCDVNAFETDDGGCCDSGGRGAGGSVVLALLVMLGFRRGPKRRSERHAR